MTKMFKTVTRTWNPFSGCLFNCYNDGCWARRLAMGKLRNVRRYRDGFKPTYNEGEMAETFKPGEFIGVALMGDIAFATRGQAGRILAKIEENPGTDFLIQSKNPHCFWRWRLPIPPNVYLGTTLETNRDYGLTLAPAPAERLRWLRDHPHGQKFLSIEPVMDFNVTVMVEWVESLKPDIIEIGADNYKNSLPEPPWWKVEELLSGLRLICTTVVEKEGLERLKGDSV